MRRFKPAERLFSSVGLLLMERGRLAIACLPGIANPRNAWRETFWGKYLALVIIKFKVQISKFKVMTMFKTIDFRALTAILLFLLALLFSLPNLVIAIVLMMIISAILEVLRKLADWQPKKQGKLLPRIS